MLSVVILASDAISTAGHYAAAYPNRIPYYQIFLCEGTFIESQEATHRPYVHVSNNQAYNTADSLTEAILPAT